LSIKIYPCVYLHCKWYQSMLDCVYLSCGIYCFSSLT